MKKFLLLSLILGVIFPMSAKLEGNGYYRVQNMKTKRYAYVRDDKGRVDYTSTTADVAAIELWSGLENTISDPATIIYISKHSGSEYDLEAQGAKVSEFMSAYPKVIEDKRYNAYLCYGQKSGASKYLGDIATNDASAQGVASVDAEGDRRYWYIEPVSTSTENYFGVKPTMTINGRRFATLYADFPFQPFSSGMKVYTISRIEKGMAILKEITGVVPAATPVIIECSSDSPANNKLTIGGSGSSVGTNLLGGVYFHNTLKTHQNLTAYKKDTMRILGTDANGNPAFVTSSTLDYLPANQAYLKVPTGSGASLRMVTEKEYEDLKHLPEKVSLSPANVTNSVGYEFTLTPTLTPSDASSAFSWSSSDTSVATVDANGKVTLKGAGKAVITVTTENSLTATCSVDARPLPASVAISPESFQLIEGDVAKATATVLPENVFDASVTWSVNKPEIASVDANGNITAHAPGACTITVTTVNGRQAYARVDVTKRIINATEVKVSAPETSVMAGNTLQLTATVLPENTTDKNVSWSVDRTNYATIDQNGLLTALSQGRVRVTAKCGNVSGTISIDVTRRIVNIESITLSESELTLEMGTRHQLTATEYPEKHDSGAISWYSSNMKVAVVTNGLIIPVSEGTSTITARCGEVSATCQLTVVSKPGEIFPSSIEIQESDMTLSKGDEVSLHALVGPENANDKSIVWISSDEKVVTVNADGLLTAIGGGKATVTAYTVNAIFDSIEVTVSVPLEGISLDPTEYTAIEGSEFDLTLILTPADADQPEELEWSTTNEEVVRVDEAGHCVITGIGNAEVKVTDGQFEAYCRVIGLSGISEILGEEGSADVYNLNGILLHRNADAETIARLPKGIYIINNRKVIR